MAALPAELLADLAGTAQSRRARGSPLTGSLPGRRPCGARRATRRLEAQDEIFQVVHRDDRGRTNKVLCRHPCALAIAVAREYGSVAYTVNMTTLSALPQSATVAGTHGGH